MSSSAEMIGLSFYLVIVIVLGIIGNILILCTIFRLFMHDRGEISYIILANLAFSDCLSSLTVMPYNLASNINPQLSLKNNFLCQAGGVFTYPFFMISQSSLLLFTIEKYISIAYPFKYYSLVTKMRVFVFVFLTWIEALVFVIPIITLKWIEYGSSSGICGVIWSGKPKLLYLILTAVICFGLPFIIDVILHLHIFITAKRHVRRIHVAEVEVASNTEAIGLTEYGPDLQHIAHHKAAHKREAHRRFLKELKAAKMIFILLLEFIICLSPYAITRLLRAMNPGIDMPVVLYTFSAWLWYITAVCNPVVYLTFQKELRKGLKTMLRCCKR